MDGRKLTLSALTIGVSLLCFASGPTRSPAKHPMWMRSEPWFAHARFGGCQAGPGSAHSSP